MVRCIDIELKLGHSFRLYIPDLWVKKKSITHLIGENGCGKTSLMKAILDLYPRQKGLIEINGKDNRMDESWKSFTGVYLGTAYLLGFLSPLEYFRLVTRLRRVPLYSIENYVHQNFEGLLTPEMLQKRTCIRDLSSGNQARVGLIAAMLGHPALLLLDEPFVYLDQSAKKALQQLLQQFCENGKTILFTCHDSACIEELATTTIKLENGIMIN